MPIKNSLNIILFAMILVVGIYFMPWKNINWGKIKTAPISTVTVIGEARGIQKNQIANFTAGINAEGNDKQIVIDEVNQKMTALIEVVKNFGIDEADIQTQNISVHEQKNPIEVLNKQQNYQWRVNNSIVITLRNIDRTSELTHALSNTGANNIYGPNFQLDKNQDNNENLLTKALENAKEKANKVAQFDNKKIGEIISVSETLNNPISQLRTGGIGFGGGEGAPVEVGTSTTYKQILVVFELK